MGLNIAKGNMYDFVSHTFNTIKGKCFHNCKYCYMRQEKLNPVRLDEKELKTDLGKGNFIFVGSSCDMFSKNIPGEWIDRTIDYCNQYDNKYFFQTKNPIRILDYIEPISDKSVICTTIETNRFYPSIMNFSPEPFSRAINMATISKMFLTYVTIEPIMDFDLPQLVELIKMCNPKQVNIGADSKGHKLPEPGKQDIYDLIEELQKFTNVKCKANLKRLLK